MRTIVLFSVLFSALFSAAAFGQSAFVESNGLVVIEADSLDAAKATAAKDPYALAGLFAKVDVRPWNWAIKNPAATA